MVFQTEILRSTQHSVKKICCLIHQQFFSITRLKIMAQNYGSKLWLKIMAQNYGSKLWLKIVSFFAKHCIINIFQICVLKKASHRVDSEKSGPDKALLKSTPEVNFTNILLKAFTGSDPKSAHIKALCKMFGKSKVMERCQLPFLNVRWCSQFS